MRFENSEKKSAKREKAIIKNETVSCVLVRKIQSASGDAITLNMSGDNPAQMETQND